MKNPKLILTTSVISAIALSGCLLFAEDQKDNKQEKIPAVALTPADKADTATQVATPIVEQPEKTKNQLFDTEWILVNNSLQGFDSKWQTPPNPISIKFLADGKAVGCAGINRYNCNATIQEQGNSYTVKFSPAASTRMMGPGLELEMQYLKTLQTATNFKIENNKLVLMNGDKSIAEFVAPATGIKGVEWVLDLNSLSGTDKDWEKPDQAITLSINSEGQLSGCAGVNRYFGNPELNEKSQTLQLDKLGCTMMMGPGAEYETKYLQTIATANKYKVSADGKSMMLLKGDEVVAKFNKK